MKIDTKTKDAVKAKLAERDAIHPDIQSAIDAHDHLCNANERALIKADAKRISRTLWGLRQKEVQQAETKKRIEAEKSINVKPKKGK